MQVQLVLLRALAGELRLTPGTVLGARVLDRGTLSLAGVRLAATLPPGLEPGTAVRLRVREATGERLVLQVVEREHAAPTRQADGPAAPPVPTAAVSLPGGATARALVDPDGGEGAGAGRRRGGPRTVTLRYESPGLGRLDLALALEGGLVSAAVHAPAGEVADRLRAGAGELREALSAALGVPARVAVLSRPETLDVRA